MQTGLNAFPRIWGRPQTVDKPRGCIEGAARHSRPGPSGPASAENLPKGRFSGRFGPFDCNPQAATCASPRAGVCRRQWRKQADEGPMRHRAYRLALVQAGMRQCRIARFNRMLLPISICGRKKTISRHFCLEMPFYSKLMFPSKDCLLAFDGRASTLSML